MEEFARTLRDAGCSAGDIQEIVSLWAAGNSPDVIRRLRRVRCGLMEALHESQSRVDCLDYLIRSLEKDRVRAQRTRKDLKS